MSDSAVIVLIVLGVAVLIGLAILFGIKSGLFAFITESTAGAPRRVPPAQKPAAKLPPRVNQYGELEED